MIKHYYQMIMVIKHYYHTCDLKTHHLYTFLQTRHVVFGLQRHNDYYYLIFDTLIVAPMLKFRRTEQILSHH